MRLKEFFCNPRDYSKSWGLQSEPGLIEYVKIDYEMDKNALTAFVLPTAAAIILLGAVPRRS